RPFRWSRGPRGAYALAARRKVSDRDGSSITGVGGVRDGDLSSVPSMSYSVGAAVTEDSSGCIPGSGDAAAGAVLRRARLGGGQTPRGPPPPPPNCARGGHDG